MRAQQHQAEGAQGRQQRDARPGISKDVAFSGVIPPAGFSLPDPAMQVQTDEARTYCRREAGRAAALGVQIDKTAR